MTEPVVSYPLRVVLDRIENDLREMRNDVAALKTGSAVAVAAAATSTARRALWVAAASPVVSAVVAYLAYRR